MAKQQIYKYLNTLARVMVIATVMFGFGLILEHTTHHLDDHDTCEICWLASVLFVSTVVLLCHFHIYCTRIKFKAQTFYSTPVLNSRIIRAPPALLLISGQ